MRHLACDFWPFRAAGTRQWCGKRHQGGRNYVKFKNYWSKLFVLPFTTRLLLVLDSSTCVVVASPLFVWPLFFLVLTQNPKILSRFILRPLSWDKTSSKGYHSSFSPLTVKMLLLQKDNLISDLFEGCCPINFFHFSCLIILHRNAKISDYFSTRYTWSAVVMSLISPEQAISQLCLLKRETNV